MTGQGSVTIPPMYESRVPRDFTLAGDEIPPALTKKKDQGSNDTRCTPDQTAPRRPDNPASHGG